MSKGHSLKKNNINQIRVASAVIIFTILVWMLASYAGGKLELEVRYAFLIDFCAIASFLWSLAVIIRVWLKRRMVEEN